MNNPKETEAAACRVGSTRNNVGSAHSGFQHVDSLKKENGELGWLEQRLKTSEEPLEEKAALHKKYIEEQFKGQKPVNAVFGLSSCRLPFSQ